MKRFRVVIYDREGTVTLERTDSVREAVWTFDKLVASRLFPKRVVVAIIDSNDEEVIETTETHAADDIDQFLLDCTEASVKGSVQASHLYAAYAKWSADNGKEPMTMTAFGRKIPERGIERIKRTDASAYLGMSLRGEA